MSTVLDDLADAGMQAFDCVGGVDYPADIGREIKKRDERDSSRAIAPLKPADDAHIIDSTEMSIKEVLETIHNLIDESSINR